MSALFKPCPDPGLPPDADSPLVPYIFLYLQCCCRAQFYSLRSHPQSKFSAFQGRLLPCSAHSPELGLCTWTSYWASSFVMGVLPGPTLKRPLLLTFLSSMPGMVVLPVAVKTGDGIMQVSLPLTHSCSGPLWVFCVMSVIGLSYNLY